MNIHKNLKARLLAFTNQVKQRFAPQLNFITSHSMAKPLMRAWQLLYSSGRFINARLIMTFFLLFVGTQLHHCLFPQPQDKDYPDMDLDHLRDVLGPMSFFFARSFLFLAPNLFQALLELILIPDIYGIIDESQFSEELKTQLRRNPLLRAHYLLYRERRFQSGTENRQKDNMVFDLNEHPSQYTFLSEDNDESNDADGCE